MSAGPPRSLRFGAIFLLIGGVLQVIGIAVAVVASVINLLSPGGDPPGIAIVAFVWLPVAAILTLAAIHSWLALRAARANEARRAGVTGLLGGGVSLLLVIFGTLTLGPDCVFSPIGPECAALGVLLMLPAAPFVGALFCFAAARAGSPAP